MTFLNMVSACFLGNLLSWITVILVCLPIAIIELMRDKNNDDKNE